MWREGISLKRILLLIVAVLVAVGTMIMANNGVIQSYPPNVVSDTATRLYRFEPSSAAGSNWVTSWRDTGGVDYWFVRAWNPNAGVWNTPINVNTIVPVSTSTPCGDVFLSWDSSPGMDRPVFVCVTFNNNSTDAVYYGYATDSTGTLWVLGNGGNPVLSGGGWDYPSIGVDASGRIVIAAVLSYQSPYGFWSVVSTNHGATFTNVTKSGTSGLVASSSQSNPSRSTAYSRVVATDNRFEAFVQEESSYGNGIPVAVERWESFDGINWSLAQTLSIPGFGAPKNNSAANIACGPNGCGAIRYEAHLDAKGSTSGAWLMGVPVNYSGYNNIMICASTRGCGIANAALDDEFLQGVSVSTDGRFWVSYFAYNLNSQGNEVLPLIKQSIFFPYTSGNGVGATVDSNIDPSYWAIYQQYCDGTENCFHMGDFATIASNPYAGVTTPYTVQVPDTSPPSPDSSFNHMQQIFSIDPQGIPSATSFKPNTIWFPAGTKSIAYLANPVPSYALGHVMFVGPTAVDRHRPPSPPSAPKRP